MGAFLDTPRTDKHVETGGGNDLLYGLSSMQGWRVEMEDAHSTITSIDSSNLSKWSYFAVFDGHAGGKVAINSSEQLLTTILNTNEFKSLSNEDPDIDAVKSGIRQGFLNLDELMHQNLEAYFNDPVNCSHQDAIDRSGSTAVAIFVSPTHYYFANCGDSRALLVRGGRVHFATADHKPSNPIEKDRIIKAGGNVLMQRVNGSLAVSRSLGDFEYKTADSLSACEQQVSPEPDIDVIERDISSDEFLILACDGIWDVMSNEEIAQFVISRLQVHKDITVVCNELIDTCLYKGSRDNMSIIIVALPAAPKVNESAIEIDSRLDKSIEEKIKEYIDQSPVYNVGSVIEQLKGENLPGLPPGGGLESKRTLIDQIFKRLTIGYSLGDNQDSQVNMSDSPS